MCVCLCLLLQCKCTSESALHTRISTDRLRCWTSCPTAFLSHRLFVFVNGLFLMVDCWSVTSTVLLSVVRLLCIVCSATCRSCLNTICLCLEDAFRGMNSVFVLQSLFLDFHPGFGNVTTLILWSEGLRFLWMRASDCLQMHCMCPEYILLCDPCSCMFAQHVGVNAIYCIYAVMSVYVFVCVCVHVSQWGSKSSRLISSQSPAEQMWGLIRQGIGGGAYALACVWGRDGPASLKFDKISVCGDIILYIYKLCCSGCLFVDANVFSVS